MAEQRQQNVGSRSPGTPYDRTPPRSPRTALASIGIEAPRRRRAPDALPITDMTGRRRERSTSLAHSPPARLRDADRPRSHGDGDVTLGAVTSGDGDSIEQALSFIIDEDCEQALRAEAFESMLRDEFRVRQQEMQRETIEHVALQSQIVVREASAEINSRRSELADEWQTHQYRSQLAVEEVEQNSRALVAEVEANVADQYRLTAYQAVSQLEVAHSHRDRESRQAYALLERHALERDLVFRTEMELQVQRREALHTELVQASANSNILVSRAQVEADAARNVDRGNMQRRLVSFETTEQQRQLQLRQQLQQRLDDEQQQLLRAQATASSTGTELDGLQQQNAIRVSKIEAHRSEEIAQRNELHSWKATVQQVVNRMQEDADSVEFELRAELNDAKLQIRQAATRGIPSFGVPSSNADDRLIAELREALAESRSELAATQDEANMYGQEAWNYEGECDDLQERFVEYEAETAAEAKAAPAAPFRIHTPDG